MLQPGQYLGGGQWWPPRIEEHAVGGLRGDELVEVLPRQVVPGDRVGGHEVPQLVEQGLLDRVTGQVVGLTSQDVRASGAQPLRWNRQYLGLDGDAQSLFPWIGGHRQTHQSFEDVDHAQTALDGGCPGLVEAIGAEPQDVGGHLLHGAQGHRVLP